MSTGPIDCTTIVGSIIVGSQIINSNFSSTSRHSHPNEQKETTAQTRQSDFKLRASSVSASLPTTIPVSKGVLLIFNYVDYIVSQLHRSGSNEDADRLCGRFKSFGFEVHRYNNLDAQQIRETVERFRASMLATVGTSKQPDFICVAVMSHGESKLAEPFAKPGEPEPSSEREKKERQSLQIVTSKCERVNFNEDIYLKFTDAGLNTIDKWFLVAACRNEVTKQTTDDIKRAMENVKVDPFECLEDSNPISNSTSLGQTLQCMDFQTDNLRIDDVTFYSTSFGTESIRYKNFGTPFMIWLDECLKYFAGKPEYNLNHVMLATEHYVHKATEQKQKPWHDHHFHSRARFVKMDERREIKFESCSCALHTSHEI